MITEDYAGFEVAKLLKEKGFDESTSVNYFVGDDKHRSCVAGEMIYHKRYEGDVHLIACPTLQMAMKWLREVHKLFIFISPWTMLENNIQYYFEIREIKTSDFETLYDYTSKELNSVEKACEAGIRYCLENLV